MREYSDGNSIVVRQPRPCRSARSLAATPEDRLGSRHRAYVLSVHAYFAPIGKSLLAEIKSVASSLTFTQPLPPS
jgi:hypothetical protein